MGLKVLVVLYGGIQMTREQAKKRKLWDRVHRGGNTFISMNAKKKNILINEIYDDFEKEKINTIKKAISFGMLPSVANYIFDITIIKFKSLSDEVSKEHYKSITARYEVISKDEHCISVSEEYINTMEERADMEMEERKERRDD